MSRENENKEWRLGEYLDMLASELDAAQDLLALKAKIRPLSIGIHDFKATVAVRSRVDPCGQIFYQTVEPGTPGATLLEIDLAQIESHQITERYVEADEDRPVTPLGTLDGIEPNEIAALESVSIFDTGQLTAAIQRPADLTRLTRHTRVSEARLRSWLNFPFLTALEPATAIPAGGILTMTGGHFGERDEAAQCMIGELSAPIVHWSDDRLEVQVPEGAGPGPVYVTIDGAATNALIWKAGEMRLEIESWSMEPSHPSAGEPARFQLTVTNKGAKNTAATKLGWSVDDRPLQTTEIRALGPGQSQSVTIKIDAAAGDHHVRFTIDPEHILRLTSRGETVLDIPFTIETSPPLDVVVFGFKTEPSNPSVGAVRLLAVVHNCGDRSTGPLPIRWIIDHNTVTDGTVPAIGPGQKRQISRDLTFEAGTHVAQLILDPEQTLSLSNRDDTAIQQTIMIGQTEPSSQLLLHHEMEPPSQHGDDQPRVFTLRIHIENRGDQGVIHLPLRHHFRLGALFKGADPKPNHVESNNLMWDNLAPLEAGDSITLVVRFQAESFARTTRIDFTSHVIGAKDAHGAIPEAFVNSSLRLPPLLADLTGIPDKNINKLREAGIDTIDKLASGQPEELASATGLSKRVVQSLIRKAQVAKDTVQTKPSVD